jgi:hypothetical protein
VIVVESPEDALDRCSVAEFRVRGLRFGEAGIDVIDVRRAEIAGPDTAKEFDEEFRRPAGRPGFVDLEKWGESLRDRRPAPDPFGWAMLFCESSKACAASAVANDLRLRLPLRSYQSARYLFPFSYIGHLWTPL